MKNVTIVVATTFALVTTAMAVEMARRQSVPETTPPAAMDAPIAALAAEPPSDVAAPARPPRLPGMPFDDVADAPLPTWTKTAVSPETAAALQSEQAPMRDATPVIAREPELKANEAAAPEPKPMTPAAQQAQAPLSPSGDHGVETQDRADAMATPAKAKTAIVKPVMVKPASSKAPTERADKPAAAPRKAAEPSNGQVRLARRGLERDAEEPRLERHAARPMRLVKWRDREPAPQRYAPQVYNFSGSFGGCQYRGFVSAGGYRILSSC